jgi:hypothetical protein
VCVDQGGARSLMIVGRKAFGIVMGGRKQGFVVETIETRYSVTNTKCQPNIICHSL